MANHVWDAYADKMGESDSTTPKGQGDYVDVTEHNENAQGAQDEFDHVRAVSFPYSGVVSGMTPTEDEANDRVNIAAGVAVLSTGKKLKGGTSTTLIGESSGNFWAHADVSASSEATAYVVTTAQPSRADLIFATLTWNGTDTITAFTDVTQWGVEPGEFTYSQTAEDTAASGISGKIVKSFYVNRPLCLRLPWARLHTCGTSGSANYVDIHAGTPGSTASVWSSAGSRITIPDSATDGAFVAAGTVPNQNYKLSVGDVVEIHMDNAAAGAAGLDVYVPYTYY